MNNLLTTYLIPPKLRALFFENLTAAKKFEQQYPPKPMTTLESAAEWKRLEDSIPADKRVLSPWWRNLDAVGMKRAGELAPWLCGLFK